MSGFPEFYLVGAPKAGTTSVYNYLRQHPGIFTPAVKEPHFFSCPEVKDTYYDVAFVEEEVDYLALYADAGDRLRGDFSPSYLYRTAAAERIHGARPDARILVLLRDPVERAISHYLMDVRSGYQQRPLGQCLVRSSETRLFRQEYVDVGLYASQLRRYLELFGPDRVHVSLYEELRASPATVVAPMVAAVGADPSVRLNVGRAHNEHRNFRSPRLGRIMGSATARFLIAATPDWIKQRARRSLTTTRKPPFEAERRWLRQIFAEDVAELEHLLGRSLPWLRN